MNEVLHIRQAQTRRRSTYLFQAAAFLLVLGYALAFQGSRHLWERDEGRYTQVALEMIESGDWWTPRLYYPETLHFTKPPGTYWAIAASIVLLGKSEWAVRLPNALAFTLTIFLIFSIAGKLKFGKMRARLAALIYASFLFPFLAANAVTTDTLLCAAETVAVWGFTGWYFGKSESMRKTSHVVMWFAFSLAFLIKGPPGLLPGLALGVFLGFRDGWRRIVRLFSWPGFLIFSVVGLGWYISQILMRPELLSYFIKDETIARMATNAKGRNGDFWGPLRIYLPTLLIGPLPWILLPGMIPIKKIKTLFSLHAWRRWKTEDPAQLLLLFWFFIPLVVFILSRSRLPLYLLPIFVPLALLLAHHAPDSFLRPAPAMIVGAGTLILVLIGIRFAASRIESSQDASQFAAVIRAAEPGHFEEIVFVSTRAWYGLGYYLDCGIESVAINEEEQGKWHDQTETLATETTEDSEQRIYVSALKRRADLERVLSRNNMRGNRISVYGNLDVYRIEVREAP